MQTTELIVEILVIGGGVSICLTPVVAYLLGVPPSTLLSRLDLKEFLVVVITAVYPLGIVWNRVADGLFSRAERKLRAQYFDSDDNYHLSLIRIYLKNTSFGDRLYQVRSLYRIARASTLTFLLAAAVFPPALRKEASFHLCNY